MTYEANKKVTKVCFCTQVYYGRTCLFSRLFMTTQWQRLGCTLLEKLTSPRLFLTSYSHTASSVPTLTLVEGGGRVWHWEINDQLPEYCHNKPHQQFTMNKNMCKQLDNKSSKEKTLLETKIHQYYNIHGNYRLLLERNCLIKWKYSNKLQRKFLSTKITHAQSRWPFVNSREKGTFCNVQRA